MLRRLPKPVNRGWWRGLRPGSVPGQFGEAWGQVPFHKGINPAGAARRTTHPTHLIRSPATSRDLTDVAVSAGATQAQPGPQTFAR